MSNKFSFFDKKLMNRLYWYHLLFFLIYFTYATFNASDSKSYYFDACIPREDLMELFLTGTKFIVFVANPFVQLGFSYITMMLIFSWTGYVGFVFAYLYFQENITINVTVFKKYDLLKLLLFLPNMHFWTASLGKGSLIFMGLMLFIYALRFPQKRLIALVLGGFLVYMIRPHVMLFVLIGVMIGILTGRSKIGGGVKFLVLIVSVAFLYLAQNSILGVANLEGSENVIEDFDQFASQQSGRLVTSGSGVDMSNYPLPFKLFTFWFRPLFIDSPSAIGIFSSIENLIYLLLFLKILNKRFLKFIFKAPYLVKTSLIIFVLSSFALTFVMSNLGIIMRQKSMVMYFGFFVIYYFLASEKYEMIQKNQPNPVVLV
ncbi:hypothetical protein [Flavobacterium sp.]|uniref:hypothetical protein n=1 Tax=Flavobacterium sp. TaxID=239 RepID=UPI0038FD3BC0